MLIILPYRSFLFSTQLLLIVVVRMYVRHESCSLRVDQITSCLTGVLKACIYFFVNKLVEE